MSKRHGQFKKSFAAGFTLTELLVTMAIISLLTAIVMFRYGEFNSGAVLQGQAYELALDIRQAQVFSLSALSESASGANDSSFREEYGIYMNQSSDGQYIFFQDDNSNGGGVVRFQASPNDETLETILLDPRYRIKKMCYDLSNCPDNPGTSPQRIRYLSISFKRPNFDAQFWTRNYGNTNRTSPSVDEVHIVIEPINGTETRTVSVYGNGQILVQ